MTDLEEKSYSQILKTSALLGGSSVINVGLSALRTKILAVQLGPELFGVMGLYSTFTLFIQGVASLGLGQSAVREIAAASGAGVTLRIARTIRAYRRMVTVTGLAGIFITLLLAYPASMLTFGNNQHVWAICSLSVVVLFSQIQAGQGGLLSGLRRINDLAAISVIGAFWSTLLAIPIMLYFKQSGIIPFLIAAAAGQMIASWWYARRVIVQPVPITWIETWELSRSMLTLGMSFVVAGVATSFSAYVIRLVINRHLGDAAVGLYQSSFAICSIYVGFVLQGMGSDYLPRLANLVGDVEKQNQLVNQQAKMAILLAVPGLIGALVLSDLLIWVMYSERFSGASGILRWQVLGLLGRIISWPMGFIIIARGDGRSFVFSEIASAIVHVGLVWIGVIWLGVDGAGVAFAGLYVFNILFVYFIVHVRHDYVPSKSTCKTMVVATIAVGLSFAATFIPLFSLRIGTGLMLLFACSFICLECLTSLIPSSRPTKLWRRIRGVFSLGFRSP